MNPCERFKNNILDFIDNELDSIRKKELRRHVEKCHDCECLVRQIRVLRTQLKSLPRIKTSENFNILLRDNIRRELAGKRKFIAARLTSPSRLLPALGFALVLIAFGVWTVSTQTSWFRSPQRDMSRIARTMPAIPEGDASVQYVIEEVPRLPVSRDDTPENVRMSREDSMMIRRRREEIQSRMTTVSF